MARNPTRRQIVSQAIQARKPAHNGGTTAPRSIGKGPRVGPGKRARIPQWRPGGPITGPIRPGKTRYTPGTHPSTPGSPAAPANAAPTPWNTKAEEIVNAARRNYLGENTNFDLAERAAKQDFGLDRGFNDYKANPYSRAALLEQSYQNANRGTVNSRGLQLYSGSTSNVLGSNRSTYDSNRDQLAKAYRDALGEISTGRAKSAQEKAEREREAESERITAAEAQEPDAEAAPPGEGGGGGGGGGGGKKKKQPKQKPKPGPGIGPGKPVSKPKKKGK